MDIEGKDACVMTFTVSTKSEGQAWLKSYHSNSTKLVHLRLCVDVSLDQGATWVSLTSTSFTVWSEASVNERFLSVCLLVMRSRGNAHWLTLISLGMASWDIFSGCVGTDFV